MLLNRICVAIVLCACFNAFATKKTSTHEKLLRDVANGNLENIIQNREVKNHPELSQLLTHALTNSQYDIAVYLLESGARADVENEYGDTALIAAMKNHVLSKRLLDLMVASGANLDHVHERTGMTAMMYAAKSGFINGISLLSNRGYSLDRINLRDGKGLLDYAQDQATLEFLMKSHRYIAKSLNRYGYRPIYDIDGLPKVLAMGADGIIFFVKNKIETKIAKFFYNRTLFKVYEQLEYQKSKHKEDQLAKHWKEWFNNKAEVQLFDVFAIKNWVKGKTLAHWMTGLAVETDFGSDHPNARFARQKLKELIIRMLRKNQGFVGDLNPSNMIFSEQHQEWVVIDGKKAVACYSAPDHEWIWVEYCQAAMELNKESLLKAFKSYAVGPSATGHKLDIEAFGIWLLPRTQNGRVEAPSELSKSKMMELINSITPADLE